MRKREREDRDLIAGYLIKCALETFAGEPADAFFDVVERSVETTFLAAEAETDMEGETDVLPGESALLSQREQLLMSLGWDIERRIRGGLKATIHDHGPITADMISSAAKRIMGLIAGDLLKAIRERG